MSKTDLTNKLEKAIQVETSKWFGCLEVTLGWDFGAGRVDYMTMDTKEIFRCYELKISKSDFHSKHGHNFVGNYNYYVIPLELYEEIKDEIDNNVGVYTWNGKCLNLIKRARKQELKVDIQILKNSMIRSLYRDVSKYYSSQDEDIVQKYKKKFNKLQKEKDKLYRDYVRLSNDYTYLKRHGISLEEAEIKRKSNLLSIQNTNNINDLKTYSDWCPVFEKENKMKIIDDDGGREICWEDKENTLLTKQEAFNYFIKNTIEFKGDIENEKENS